jgi:hypothetical protein
MQALGKALIVFGLLVAAMGALFLFAGKLPWIGRLPGDIYLRRENFSFYFPLTTSIILSLLISFIIWLIRR